MNYTKINQELDRYLGKRVARCQPTKNGYKLRFASDNPNPATVAIAKYIAEQHSKTAWDKSAKVGR
jgi:hypothetical protein